jgi:hypothetical protein
MCFLLLKIPKFRVPFDTILLWKCVCLSTYECLQKYACILITYVHHVIHFLNFLSYHHWRKLNVNQIDTQCFHFIFHIFTVVYPRRNDHFKVGLVVWMKFCRLLCIIASIEYIRRQLEESFTSCIKGLIRKLTEIHILTIQSGVNKRNKNRGEHSVIKHPFSIHSYIPVIKKYHGNQM